MPARVLVFSAAIGEGHDGPARTLSAGLLRRGALAQTVDTFTAAGPLAQRLVGVGSQYDSRVGSAGYDVAHRLIAQWRPGQRATGRALEALFGKRLLGVVAAHTPEVIVATYPGASEVLGRLRLRGALSVPVVSAITDLASLRYWAHAGVDQHLIVHPESGPEVHAVAGGSARVTPVHGLIDPLFRAPRPLAMARAALELPAGGPIVVVSGGGWAVGDLGGAAEAARAAGAARVVVLCGRRDDVARSLRGRFSGVAAVEVWGFSERLPELLAAADVLVHSTAGLTVLEALMCGCHVISYGWGQGHIRANNRAYRRHGLTAVARTRRELAGELSRALAAGRAQPLRLELADAADVVLSLVGG